MGSAFGLSVLIAGLIPLVAGQTGAIGLCTGTGCAYCPNTLTQQGTGYPACVVYNRDVVLGGYAKDYKTEADGDKQIWYNIPHVTNDNCRTIIRTPADTDVANCGYPIFAGKGGVCTSIETKSTLMVQFCCGTGDCTSAGAEKRTDESTSLTSMVLRDSEGHLIVPHAVAVDGQDMMNVFLGDHGINATTAVPMLSKDGMMVYKSVNQQPERVFEPVAEEAGFDKRDCDKYVADGGTYTALGDVSYRVSAYICGSGTSETIMNSQSVSRTTTFSASVSDPFGIVSASTGFQTTKSSSQSYSYTFKPTANQCGHVEWTPIFLCTKGKIEGCKSGTQYGDVCTADRVNAKQLNGVYSFVQTN